MSWKLSPLGENHARRVSTVKEPENAVLCFMYETKDPVEMDEILDETHMDDSTAQKVMSRLTTKGYIKEV